jgi:hypothetical protein
MNSTVYSLSLNLLAAVIGWLAAVGFAALRRLWQRRRRVRAFRDFFGTSGHLLVIHSAVLDELSADNYISGAGNSVYNYPATDIRATRFLVRLFESVGLEEGADFNISPDIRVKTDHTLWDNDLVLLCGPARNRVLRDLTPAIRMRYAMEVGQSGSNILRDMLRGGQQMLASRELPQPTDDGDFDYGLVASLPNPNNHSRQLVILAGIHGTGTVGAAQLITTGGELRKMATRRKDHVVSEVVQVLYDGDIETPTSSRLV